MLLSVIIPSWKDKYLVPTINSLLENSRLGDQIEIIPVLDGYWRDDIPEDKRVNVLHLGKNRGMRDAINAGVDISRGTFIMRTDEHCMFSPGYDKELTSTCQDDWIMTMRRYFLDPVKWEVMPLDYIDYEKMALREGNEYSKFEGRRWTERKRERAYMDIDETMAMQGSMWIMNRSWWDKTIVKLDTEGYGPLYQDSTEMIFKTWKSGGKLMLNKRAWYAHKHVSFTRTHQYGVAEAKPGWQHSIDTWKDYYTKEVKPKWGI